MTDVAALIADMVKAGVDPELIGRTAAALAERETVVLPAKVDEVAERKRAADRERMREKRDIARLSRDNSDEVSPKKETSPTPPKEKTTPSQSETNVSSKTPRAALETVLDAERAGQVLDHRQRIRKPLTARAAELLADQFAACPDPNAAADAMVLNGWQGFKPEWMERQQSRGSPPQTNRPQTASEILRNRRIQGNQTDDDRTAGTPRLVAIGHVS